jgi:hypothetical protein
MKRAGRIALSLASLSAILLATGCYERVVGAKGMGASYADIQPGYRSDTAADRAFDSLISSPKPQNRAERWVDPNARR